MLVCRQ